MSKFEMILGNLPKIIWCMILGVIEWVVPRSWYAKDVSNEIVLITGAGSGLGREITLEFAKLGASLVLWDIDQEGLRKTQELADVEHRSWKNKYPGQAKKFCSVYNVDVSKRENIQEAAKKVHQDLNADDASASGEKYVSVLVNNAGIYYGVYMQDLSDQQIEKMFQINILAHFWTVRAFLPKMIQFERGHIVEIASYGGINGGIKQVTYCSTKFATVGFEESLSIELDHLGLGDKIKTTAICPLFFKSNLFDGIGQSINLMSAKFVAKEAVLAMRCNHARLFLPKLAYILWIVRTFSNRQALFVWSRALGLDQGLRDIRGRGLDQ